MSLNAPLYRREDQGAGLEPAKRDKRSPRKTTTARKTTSGHGASWTSERVEQLKGCIRAGLTCSQIAAEIGVTRNAVIGKMNRLGLSRPKDAAAVPRARGKDWEGAEPKRAAWGARSVRLFSQHRILVALPPEPAAFAGATATDGRGCSLLDLKSRTMPLADQRDRRRGFLLLRGQPGGGPALLRGPRPHGLQGSRPQPGLSPGPVARMKRIRAFTPVFAGYAKCGDDGVPGLSKSSIRATGRRARRSWRNGWPGDRGPNARAGSDLHIRCGTARAGAIPAVPARQNRQARPAGTVASD